MANRTGTRRDDVLIGTVMADLIRGGAGDDLLLGDAGADSLYGDDGHDRLYGGAGADFLDGGKGDDLLLGDDGDDRLYGQAGDDWLYGGDGSDELTGGSGADLLNGGDGTDTAYYAGKRADYLVATVMGAIVVRDLKPKTSGDDGTDVLYNVERLRFGDGTVIDLGPNQAPVAEADTAFTSESAALAGASVLGNDRDADGDPLKVTGVNGQAVDVGRTVTLASGAKLTMQADGTYAYDPNGAFDHLGLNADGTSQTATDSFSYTVSDGSGGSATATVTITVTGDNAAPVITTAIAPPAAMVEDGVTSASGLIGFDDADLSDAHTVSATPRGDGYLGAFTAFVSAAATGPGAGGVTWSFDVADADLQFLAEGETLEQVYRVAVDDGHGGVATRDVVVTIRGTNDGPEIGAAASAEVAERADGAADENDENLAASGVIAFDDPDLADGHGFSLELISATDANGASVEARGEFAGAVSPAQGAGAGSIGWDFAVAASALDELAAGETITQVYRFTVTDDHGASASSDVTVTLTGSNDAPKAAGSTASGDEDSGAITGRVPSASDADGDAITYALVGDPVPGLSFDPDGSYSFAPASDFNGTVSFRYVASDGVADSAPATVTITVTPVNDAPVAAGDALSVAEDQALLIDPATLLANDSDAEGGALAVVAAGPVVIGGSIRFVDGRILFTPAPNFNGQAGFDYRIADPEGGVGNGRVVVTVMPVNDAPVLARPIADQSTPEDAAWSFTLPAGAFSDVDSPNLTLSASLGGGGALPSWLSFDAASRTFTGTPPQDFNGGLTLRVTASDGLLSVADEFTLAVTPVNDAPVARNDGGFSTNAGTPLTILSSALLANDDDADGDALGIQSVSGAANGSVAIDSGGNVVFTPTAGYSGAASFTYVAADPGGATSQAVTVSLLVDPVTNPASGLSTGVPAGTELRYFARFVESANGRAVASDGADGWVALDFFDLALNDGGRFAAGGVTLSFGPDRAAASLFGLMGSGAKLNFEVEAYRSTDQGLQLVDEYLFEDAFATREEIAAGSHGFGFAFDRLAQRHTEHDAKGAKSAVTAYGWDLVADAAASFDSSASYLTKAGSADVASVAPTYYVRFVDAGGRALASNGVNGWTLATDLGLSFTRSADRGADGDLKLGLLSAGSLDLVVGASNISAVLTEAAFRGERLGLQVEAWNIGGARLIDEFLFEEVSVLARKAEYGAETFSLAFARFEHGHSDYSAKGGLEATVASGWDFALNGPADLADAVDLRSADPAAAVSGERMTVARFVDVNGKALASGGTNGWIELDDFEFAVGNNPRPGAEPLKLGFASDRLAVALDGKLLAGATVNLQVETLVDGLLVDEYLFNQVRLDDRTADSSDHAVTLYYGAFQHEHTTYDAKGGAQAPVGFGWDFVTGQTTRLTDGGVDFTAADRAASGPGELSYVVRFVNEAGGALPSGGTSGWVTASSMQFDIVDGRAATLHLGLAHDTSTVALARGVLGPGGGTGLTIEVEAFTDGPDGRPVLVEEYLFQAAPLWKQEVGAGPTRLDFSIAAYEHSHAGVDGKSSTSPVTTGWSFRNGAAIDLLETADFRPVVDQAGAAPELSYYGRFVDADGKVVASGGRDGWIALDSFTAALSRGDHGAELGFSSDKAELALIRSMLEGREVKLEVEAYARTGDGSQMIDEYLFERVTIGSQANRDGSSTFSLDFGAFEISHVGRDAKGGATAATSFGWDFVADREALLQGSGDYGRELVAGGGRQELAYYVRLLDEDGDTIPTDGGRSWIAAGDFELDLTRDAGALRLEAGSDRALLQAIEALLARDALGGVEVEVYASNSNGQSHIVTEYLFDKVGLDSYSASGPTVETDLWLDFAAFQQAQFSHDGKGGQSFVQYGWDFAQRDGVVLAPPHADLFF